MGKRSINPKAGMLVGEFRHKSGMSQAALAALSGVQQSGIAELESGRSGMGVERLNAVADALPLSLKQRIQLIEAAGFRLTPPGA